MKNKSLIVATIALLFISVGLTKSDASQNRSAFNAGKINLGLATALHPKMSLFDFQRMGFYKVKLGLNKSDFEQKVAELKKTDDQNKKIELEIINQKLLELNKSTRDISNKEGTINPQLMGAESKQKLGEIGKKTIELLHLKAEIDYSIRFPELTPPQTTREILTQIENEILQAINKVAKDLHYDIIFNSNTPYSNGYPDIYKSAAKFSSGPVGINQHLFYAFLSEKSPLAPESKEDLTAWLSIISRPESQQMLPIKPWPLVLKGGKSILFEVMQIIYEQYDLENDILPHIKECLTELNCLDY